MTYLNRRTIFCGLISSLILGKYRVSASEVRFSDSDNILQSAVASGQVTSASIYARVGREIFKQSYGKAHTVDCSFLLGSISKPIAITALMKLFDQNKFKLEDKVNQYIPEFKGGYRDHVSIQHLLTHVSGLPDQLPSNAALRKSHASLNDFSQATLEVPIRFQPGTQYEYSSMGILLACEIGRRISGIEFREFVNQTVFKPLGMKHSAFGLGQLDKSLVMPCQVEFGAVESGGGSSDSKDWDWNSDYWRSLGAPWGGCHASASDIALLLEEFVNPTGKVLTPDTAQRMIVNQNAGGIETRGLGWDVGLTASCPRCSDKTFGHTGSTGTIAWADPEQDRICVVLTSLPANATAIHPRQVAADKIAGL